MDRLGHRSVTEAEHDGNRAEGHPESRAGLVRRVRFVNVGPAHLQVLDGLAEAEDRQAFRALLQRLALHAATTLDSAATDPCTEPVPGSC